MNDTGQIDKQTLSRDAALNTLMYMRKYYDKRKDNGEYEESNLVPNGTFVKDIVRITEKSLDEKMEKYAVEKDCTWEEVQKTFAVRIRQLRVLQNAVKNDPGLGELVMANRTVFMKNPQTGEAFHKDGMEACTFQDSLENPASVTVVYRGTNGGEWVDNGVALGGNVVETHRQVQAVAYFDYIVKSNGWDVKKPRIHVTGHSKGGNKTQFVVMTSVYTDLIENGYSFDGQGMSQESMENMMKEYGQEEYDRRRNRLFAISGDNDYVHMLGSNDRYGHLIPDEHYFWLESNLAGYKWHNSDCYMNEEGETLTDFCEQGTFSKITRETSKKLMSLPPSVRSAVAERLMEIAEKNLADREPLSGNWGEYADRITSIVKNFKALRKKDIQDLESQDHEQQDHGQRDLLDE